MAETTPVITNADRSRTTNFTEGLGKDLAEVCIELGLDPHLIRKLGNLMGFLIQQRLDENTEGHRTNSAVVLGHSVGEWSPQLYFEGAVYRKVDEIDPPRKGSQGRMVMVRDDGGGFTEGVAIPGGFYIYREDDGQFHVIDGDGNKYESYRELATELGVWPGEDHQK